MAKYLYRSCPRCKGYVGIVLREPGRNTPLQAINGQCLKCGYRLAWIVVQGKESARESPELFQVSTALKHPYADDGSQNRTGKRGNT